MRSRYVFSLLAGLFLLATGGCTEAPDPATTAASETNRQLSASLALDDTYLTSDRWDQGEAEFAFYEATRTHTAYDEADEHSFMVGSFTVKHAYDPNAQTKATDEDDGVSAFKSALFYRFESGSYEYRRSYVSNVRQRDLRPFKQSFTSFDWCSNQYRELSISDDDTVDYWMRSDDYGNDTGSFGYQTGGYTTAQMPLFIRSLDIDDRTEHLFYRMTADGNYVRSQAAFIRTDSVTVESGTYPAERITVTYEEPVPSMVAEHDVTQAIYWRHTGDDRRLLRIQERNDEASYTMNLVEHLWSAYWSENLWDEVERISERP
ncbi:MAG: hypothetical protein R6U20_11860 [Longimonas sp.]|uniref:hypothetical protein n=1 Tax=Longimonas sp. TaxID=2039626 RepID=UPI00397653D4